MGTLLLDHLRDIDLEIICYQYLQGSSHTSGDRAHWYKTAFIVVTPVTMYIPDPGWKTLLRWFQVIMQLHVTTEGDLYSPQMWDHKYLFVDFKQLQTFYCSMLISVFSDHISVNSWLQWNTVSSKVTTLDHNICIKYSMPTFTFFEMFPYLFMSHLQHQLQNWRSNLFIL